MAFVLDFRGGLDVIVGLLDTDGNGGAFSSVLHTIELSDEVDNLRLRCLFVDSVDFGAFWVLGFFNGGGLAIELTETSVPAFRRDILFATAADLVAALLIAAGLFGGGNGEEESASLPASSESDKIIGLDRAAVARRGRD